MGRFIHKVGGHLFLMGKTFTAGCKISFKFDFSLTTINLAIQKTGAIAKASHQSLLEDTLAVLIEEEVADVDIVAEDAVIVEDVEASGAISEDGKSIQIGSVDPSLT